MTPTDVRLKVAMFSGGRGTNILTKALLRNPAIDLTLLVNTYDDGLSTGALRRFIPGMLGPSDVRKNISVFVSQRTDSVSQALQFLLEHRLPKDISTEAALQLLTQFTDVVPTHSSQDPIMLQRDLLSVGLAKRAAEYLRAFLEYYRGHVAVAPWFSFQDCSFGNLLFGGCYLLNGQDFNRAISNFSRFAGVGDRILNITGGENRVLVAIKQDGQYLHDEASVVGPQSESRMEEIFLLPDYLDQSKDPIRADKGENIVLLRRLEQLPSLNPMAEQVLKEADVIIYGPGTQYSSLMPSYLTKGVAEAIQSNTNAEKIFIGNIARDHDILGENATTLVRAFLWNMNRKRPGTTSIQHLVTRFFFQKAEAHPAHEQTKYVSFDANEFEYPLEKVTWVDLEGEAGKHAGNRTVSEVLQIVEAKLNTHISHVSQKVSIIVPALNEERTIQKVLRELQDLSFPAGSGLEKEIIVVDGGSSDRTCEIAQVEPGVRTYTTQGKGGRGSALRLGLEKAKGDIVVFFPSDGEYHVQDILRVVSPLVSQEFPAVFGTRAFHPYDLSGRLRQVYGDHKARYVASKYGGMLLSMLALMLHQRFVSDPLTSLKGMNRRVLRDLAFDRAGVDFDMELIAKLAKSGHMILEVPVHYTARTIAEGKKTTVGDGFRCLWTLVRFTNWKPQKPPAS